MTAQSGLKKDFQSKEVYRLNLWALDLYSESESFNVIAAFVGFAGAYNLEGEADFVGSGQANEVLGWKRYSHTKTLDIGSSGEMGCYRNKRMLGRLRWSTTWKK